MGLSTQIDNGYGASAYITVGQASLCTGTTSPNHISAWAAVGSPATDGGLGQAGYRKTKNVNYWLQFGEWVDYGSNTGNEKSFGSSLSVGNKELYRVYEAHAAGTMVMTSSQDVYYTTPFDPQGQWTRPWQEQFMEERFDLGDDVPGTSSTPAHFTSLQYQGGSTCCPPGYFATTTYNTVDATNANVSPMDNQNFDAYHY